MSQDIYRDITVWHHAVTIAQGPYMTQSVTHDLTGTCVCCLSSILPLRLSTDHPGPVQCLCLNLFTHRFLIVPPSCVYSITSSITPTFSSMTSPTLTHTAHHCASFFHSMTMDVHLPKELELWEQKCPLVHVPMGLFCFCALMVKSYCVPDS